MGHVEIVCAKVADVLAHLRIRTIGGGELAGIDPLGLSFVKINTPRDRARYDVPSAPTAPEATRGT